MDDRVTTCQSFIQSGAFDHVSLNQSDIFTRQLVCLSRVAHQRTDRVALCQQSSEKMAAHKSRGTGKKDFHIRILNGSKGCGIY